ncbi:hypothetical protein IT575_08425 [bacterium]|nr:hypothetical protein [bacterium]
MSVLRINQNPVALNAQRNLKVTGMSVSKTLERLSSGLRINRAADDAAGLSISEKLRGQIRGLNRASANALDGISLIQTAEGALDEISTILQRTRELAVQAANGIYTADDRQSIQLEINQLTDEINRIAHTTEFNSKTLLDGSLGALISTDDFSRIRAAVNGNVGDGGNFILRAVAKSSGVLQIQKTDVFTTTRSLDDTGNLNFLQTWRAGAVVASAGPDGVGNAGLFQIEVPTDPNGLIAVNSPTNGTLRISGAVGSSLGNTLGQNFQASELSVGDKFMITVRGAQLGVRTVSIDIGALTLTNGNFAASIVGALGPSIATAGIFNDAANVNRFSLALLGSISIIDAKFVDSDRSGSRFYLSFDSGGNSTRMFQQAQVSFVNNNSVYTATLNRPANSSGQHFSIGDATTGTINAGFDTRYDWSQISLASATAADDITWTRRDGSNALQDRGRLWQTGPVPTNMTVFVSAASARSYAVFSFDNQVYTDRVAAGWDQDAAVAAARGGQIGATTSIGATFNGTGTVLENVKLAFDGVLQAGETATFNLSSNNVVTADQQATLADVNRFQQFGVFDGRKNVELQVYLRGTANRATINVSSNDTLEDLAGKISLAIWNPEGTGVTNSAILNLEQMPDLVHVNTIGNAKGTLSIATPVPGAELVISGEESILNALSLVEVRQGEAPVYSINAFNLELNKSIGQIETDTNEVNGLLPGVRVFFDNTLGLRLDAQPPTDLNGGPNTLLSFPYASAFERPQISLSGRIETFFVHVAPRAFTLQTGANQGQNISSYLADMSAEALGVEGLLVVTPELSQDAITQVDVAMQRVSEQRGRLGAIQNRLESTIRNLDVASENLSASESRIRDADVAQETLMMTRNQILLQSGVAAMAQANQLPQTVLQLLQ